MPGLGKDSEVHDVEYRLSAWHTEYFQHQKPVPQTFSTISNLLTATSDPKLTTLASHINWTDCLAALLPVRVTLSAAYDMQTKFFLGSVVTNESGHLIPVAFSFPPGSFKASEMSDNSRDCLHDCPHLEFSIKLEGVDEELVSTSWLLDLRPVSSHAPITRARRSVLWEQLEHLVTDLADGAKCLEGRKFEVQNHIWRHLPKLQPMIPAASPTVISAATCMVNTFCGRYPEVLSTYARPQTHNIMSKGHKLTFPRLNKKNYGTWSGYEHAELQRLGVWLNVKGTIVTPTSTDADAIRKWLVDSGKAAGSICASLEALQRVHIKGMEENPVTMWAALEKVHGEKKPGARFAAYNTLFSICKESDETLTTLMGRVDGAVSLIKDLRPAGHTLEDLDGELASMAMIRALPEEYKAFRSSLFLLPQLDKAIVTEAFILEESDRQEQVAKEAEMALALAARITQAAAAAGVTVEEYCD
ncbi:hypothetical protein B0H14DRAFT_2642281 [Mycena olivaceomarginata]|nr:hypothetical protein B0H14DRAFT_2642281 [Mycena olivaceomarginata]